MLKTVALAAALGLTAFAASAQDFYLGIGLDSTQSATDQTSVSLMAGTRFGQQQLSYGAEVDYTMSSGAFDAARLRGLVHNDLGKLDLFAALGLSNFALDGGGSATGFNYGLGAEFAVNDRMGLRVEAIKDQMPGYGSNPFSIRAGVTFGF